MRDLPISTGAVEAVAKALESPVRGEYAAIAAAQAFAEAEQLGAEYRLVCEWGGWNDRSDTEGPWRDDRYEARTVGLRFHERPGGNPIMHDHRLEVRLVTPPRSLEQEK